MSSLRRIVPTGCSSLDEQLGGGLSDGTIALVYGEAETGKSTLGIQCAVNCARMEYKTVFIDCDHTFSSRRMAQIAAEELETLAPKIILMQPEDFEQQTFVFDRLSEYISEKVGLIVVDTVTGLYRERLGNMKETFSLNRVLNRQMACLAQITKTRKVASLIISQVRSVVVEEHGLVEPVARRILEFWADITISLKPTAKTNIVRALVRTSMGKRPSKPVFLRIEESGLLDHRR